jgi:hypothetical protein
MMPNPICSSSVDNLTADDFLYYDKDGFELNLAEQKYYSAMNHPINHPILKNKDLIHVCVEGPRADNLYRGRKQLINGECEVNIDLECNTTGGMTDGTFELINKNIQVFVNNNETFDRVIGKVVGNKSEIDASR